MAKGEFIYETAVYDGRTKEWRILNLSTGTVYSGSFDDRNKALAAIEDGASRADKVVKRITLEEIVARLPKPRKEPEEEPKEWYRWATYKKDGDSMIDHDSGYCELEDAVKDATAALKREGTLAYIEITDGDQPEFKVTLRKALRTGEIKREDH